MNGTCQSEISAATLNGKTAAVCNCDTLGIVTVFAGDARPDTTAIQQLLSNNASSSKPAGYTPQVTAKGTKIVMLQVETVLIFTSLWNDFYKKEKSKPRDISMRTVK